MKLGWKDGSRKQTTRTTNSCKNAKRKCLWIVSSQQKCLNKINFSILTRRHFSRKLCKYKKGYWILMDAEHLFAGWKTKFNVGGLLNLSRDKVTCVWICGGCLNAKRDIFVGGVKNSENSSPRLDLLSSPFSMALLLLLHHVIYIMGNFSAFSISFSLPCWKLMKNFYTVEILAFPSFTWLIRFCRDGSFSGNIS